MMMRHDRRDDADDIVLPRTEATCDELRAAAWSYLDGESPPREQRSIDAHLMDCVHCRAYMQYLRAFLHALRAELRRDHQEPST